MFRHRGKSRTLIHNLKLASLLSFVAGIVNVTGLSAIQRLTTNVTGHFGYFADEMAKEHFNTALIYLLYILAFLLGAFFSNLLVESISRRNARFSNSLPVTVEILILSAIAFLGPSQVAASSNTIACMLLFAMGMQNALVTSVSDSVVRTTHLTGLFTDLGIELSQTFFYRQPEQRKKLTASIKLRLTIICSFFLGGAIGGVGYHFWGMKILLLAVIILATALVYDSVRLGIVNMKRRYRT